MAASSGLGALGVDADDEPDRGISRLEAPETSEIGRSQGFQRSAKNLHRGAPTQSRRASCGNIQVGPPRTKFGMTTLGREEFASATVYQRLNSFQTSGGAARKPPPLPSKPAASPEGSTASSGKKGSTMGEKLKEMTRIGSSKELMPAETKSGRVDRAAPSLGRNLLNRSRGKKQSQRVVEKTEEPAEPSESRTTFAFSVEDDETTAAGDTPYAAATGASLLARLRPRPRTPRSPSPCPHAALQDGLRHARARLPDDHDLLPHLRLVDVCLRVLVADVRLPLLPRQLPAAGARVALLALAHAPAAAGREPQPPHPAGTPLPPPPHPPPPHHSLAFRAPSCSSAHPLHSRPAPPPLLPLRSRPSCSPASTRSTP